MSRSATDYTTGDVRVRAGQVYVASRRGAVNRRVRVDRVNHRSGYAPSATVHEVRVDGSRFTGRTSTGLKRGDQFVVQLTHNHETGRWEMPSGYKEA